MIDQIPFAGVMDLDNTNETIQPGFHKNARNILFKGVGQKRAENLKGTRQIAYTLPTGTNECIGSYYDATKQRTIWFNYNSTGKHGIYQMINEVITPITVCGANDYLNFTLYPIHSINILYGDETVGDILYFIDSLKRPTKININKAIAGSYGTMQRSYLDVAKEPPSYAPTVAYANDLTATVNNVTKSLFQFAYSYIFDDKEESTLSYFSEIPIAPDYLNPNSLTTTNAKITVTLRTGQANVKKIRVYVRKNIESVFGDWEYITTLDKAALSIGNNTTYVFDFKNNTSGITADVKFATLIYDSVPREANTQELLNGNIVIYGAIKEGYNNDYTPNVSLTADSTPSTFNANTIGAAYNYWSRYSFGLIYFDDKGRTNGVVTSTSFDVSTPAYSEVAGVPNIPRINATINHRPPVWATSYQWVRNKNLSISKFLFWISDTTYKDDKFAYIGIQSLYNRDQDSKSILSYDFAPGDRIRFINIVGSSTIIGQDYAIEEFVNSPDISYIPRAGYFIKIKLPTITGTFNFGAQGFGSYLIEIYTPASVVDKNLNTFYEFGEVYQVGNIGIGTRYHKGGTQDQASDLTLPALFQFTKGDAYLKTRAIEAGGGGDYKTISGTAWTSLILIGVNKLSDTTTNETYLLGETPFVEPTISVLGGDTNWIIKTQGDPYTFRLKGTIKLNSPSSITYIVQLVLITGGTSTLVTVIPNYTLIVGDNTIPFDVQVAIPVSTKVYLETDNSASVSLHYYETSFEISTSVTTTTKVLDPNFSDTFHSAVNSDGRPFVIDESLVETYKPSLVRYSEAYQSGTNINRANRFYDLNYDEYDRSKGDIQRLKVRGDTLRIYQYRGVLPVGIYKQMLTSGDGSGSLIQTEKILNRYKYYDGDFGIGNQPCSLASSSSADYFTDPVRGYHIRLAGDGMTPISELYKAQFYLPPIAAHYLKGYTTDTGSTSKILGVYDFFNEEFVSVFQKAKNGATVIYAGDTLGFSEQRNGYSSNYDYMPESIVCAENTFIMWKAGAIYIQDGSARNTFFGVFYPSKISVVANKDSNVKKEFLGLGYHSDSTWTCPEITTEQGQVSNLVAGDFKDTEGMIAAAFGRDVNSFGGWAEGSYLVGVHMGLSLESTSTSLSHLSGLYVNYLIRAKTF